MGVEDAAQPKKSNSRRYVENLLGWTSEESTGGRIYETTLFTSVLEYAIVLFLGSWIIIEYFHNIYEQQYFASWDPVFFVVVLMTASAYGFTRLVSLAKSQLKPSRKTTKSPEDDY